MVHPYRTRRSNSVTLVPQQFGSFSRPGTLLTRVHSSTDLTGDAKVKVYREVATSPTLYARYGYRRDWDIRADYYNNRHYDYQPHAVNPNYAGSWYGYCGYPGYRKHYIDNYYDRYMTTPYRSTLQDSQSRSMLRLYQDGTVPYSTLDNYWINKNRMEKRQFNNYRNLYLWGRQSYLTPSYFEYPGQMRYSNLY